MSRSFYDQVRELAEKAKAEMRAEVLRQIAGLVHGEVCTMHPLKVQIKLSNFDQNSRDLNMSRADFVAELAKNLRDRSCAVNVHEDYMIVTIRQREDVT